MNKLATERDGYDFKFHGGHFSLDIKYSESPLKKEHNETQLKL